MKKIFALALVLIFALSMVACGSDDKKENNQNVISAPDLGGIVSDAQQTTEQAQDTLNQITSDITQQVVSDGVEGKWQTEIDGVVTTIEFAAGGIGSMSATYQGETQNVDIKWSVDAGKLSMTELTANETVIADYSISGNQLSMTSDGETIVLTRVN